MVRMLSVSFLTIIGSGFFIVNTYFLTESGKSPAEVAKSNKQGTYLIRLNSVSENLRFTSVYFIGFTITNSNT